MNAPVTRRALLGATAALGATALPAIAEAGIAAPDPDAGLLVRIARWPTARAAYDAACDRVSECWSGLYTPQEPPRPVALHWRMGDGLGCGFEEEKAPDGRWLRLYGFGEIGELTRKAPPLGREARHAEVVEAHFTWMDDCRAVKDRVGLTALEDIEDETYTVLSDLQDAIADTVPATLAGLAAKARWAMGNDKPVALREEWTARIAADVVAMAERGGATS